MSQNTTPNTTELELAEGSDRAEVPIMWQRRNCYLDFKLCESSTHTPYRYTIKVHVYTTTTRAHSMCNRPGAGRWPLFALASTCLQQPRPAQHPVHMRTALQLQTTAQPFCLGELAVIAEAIAFHMQGGSVLVGATYGPSGKCRYRHKPHNRM